MTEARSINRFRLTVIIVLTAVIALASFWVVEVMRRTAGDTQVNRPAGEPDFYVEKFNFVKTSPTGQVQYHISGERLTHYPDNGSYVIQNPIVNSIAQEGPPMMTRADRAIVNNNQTQIHLYDNVVSERPASQQTSYFRLRSNHMLILPEKDLMRTDKPVEVLFDQSRLTGTGMVANQATREVQILSNSRAVYQPPAAQQAR
jgi:lipopolysaccharide export system protein LptC